MRMATRMAGQEFSMKGMGMAANILRTFLAVVFYVGGGVLHLVLVVSGQHELYFAFDDATLLPFYSTVWEALVEPAVPWIVLPVILFEWAVALLMLAGGKRARAGNLAAVAWNVVLAPFGWWGWTNAILAVVHGWLASKDFGSWFEGSPRASRAG